MKTIKKWLAICLCLAMLAALAGCGKSEYVKNAEALIDAIGEVTADSGEAIEAAQKAYDALTEEDKAKVDNADVLPEAQSALEAALEAKAAAELEALRQALLGSWRAEIEEIDLMADSVDASLNDGRISFRDYADSFSVTLVLELKEDGTYSLSADEAALEATFGALKSSVVRFYDDYMLLAISDALVENGYDPVSGWDEVETRIGAKKDEIILNSLGMSLTEFVDALFSQEMLAEVAGQTNREGKYTVEPGKLHMSASLDSEPKDGDYESFSLADDTLVLTDYAGTSLAEDLIYPIAFQRIG